MGEIKTLVKTVYGPVKSRRLGISLGISLSPRERVVCDFGCVYCQYSIDDMRKAKKGLKAGKFPTIEEVKKALEKKLKSKQEFDSITFAGHGEPTMHPEFEKIVKEVYKLREKYRPSTIISLFTSASKADKVSFDLIDKVFLKLDAGDEKTFQLVSKPKRPVTLAKIAEGIAKSKAKKKIIQTMLFTGKISTMKSKSIAGYIKLLEKIKPAEVHLYTILYKPSTTKIKPVKIEQLERIAKKIRKQIGCEVKCYTDLEM